MLHTDVVPQLWTDTIDAHRHAVRDAILRTTACLVHAHGASGVSMSRIAEQAGIGRATLYQYFPDVEAILTAWHERLVGEHLQQLIAVRDQASTPTARLASVLSHYAEISHQQRDTELAALLHRGDHVVRAEHQLRALIRDLIAEGADNGELRADIAPDELANYCMHALTAASNVPSKAAVKRLVDVTLTGLRN